MIYKFYEMQGRRLLYQTETETEQEAWERYSSFMGFQGAVIQKERVRVEVEA